MSDNKPEPLGPELEGGSKALGEELRGFFTDLLDVDNLEQYHLARRDYINRQKWSPECKALLAEGSLEEIERHILAVDGSGRAKPLWVVSPPY